MPVIVVEGDLASRKESIQFNFLSQETFTCSKATIKKERNTRKRCEICSKLTINKPERRQWVPPGVFIANFEHILLLLLLVFLLLSLSMYLFDGKDKLESNDPTSPSFFKKVILSIVIWVWNVSTYILGGAGAVVLWPPPSILRKL